MEGLRDMSALLTRLLHDLRYQPVTAPQDGWLCLTLDAELAADPRRLRRVRELVVDRPQELSLPVLAMATRLAAVVLRERSGLPAGVADALDRREIAVVRRLADPRDDWPAQPKASP